MPEGDTIHYAANRIRPILVGVVPEEIVTHVRFARDDWPTRLAGRSVTGVDARGKHLFIHFEGDLVLHSHLRMTGSWGTYRDGRRWHRAPRRAWLVLSARGQEVVEFDGPVLELLTQSRARTMPQIRSLGPDIVADEFDEDEVLRRLRHDDPTRTIGDALLDQRTVAGIGNLWKCEGCFDAAVDPWRPAGTVADAEIRAVLRATRPRMRDSARGGMQLRERHIYGRAGRPCVRCGSLVQQRGQGDGNRPTFWCAQCQQ